MSPSSRHFPSDGHAYVERGLATEADVAKAKMLAPALASSVQEWRLHDGPGANDLEQAMYVTIVLAAFASSAQQQQQQSKPTTAGRNAGVVGHQPAPSHGNAGGSAGRRGGGSRCAPRRPIRSSRTSSASKTCSSTRR
jgi:hypothetical protein